MVDIIGAVASEVAVEPVVPEVTTPPEATITIVTTAKGTLGAGGIVPVGTVAEIAVTAFSANWMKPKTQADKKKIDAAKA